MGDYVWDLRYSVIRRARDLLVFITLNQRIIDMDTKPVHISLSSRVSTLYHILLEATVSNDISTGLQNNSTVPSSLLDTNSSRNDEIISIIVELLTDKKYKESSLHFDMKSLRYTTFEDAVDIYLSLASSLSFEYREQMELESVINFRRHAIRLFLLPKLKYINYSYIKKKNVLKILEQSIIVTNTMKEKRKKCKVPRSNQYFLGNNYDENNCLFCPEDDICSMLHGILVSMHHGIQMNIEVEDLLSRLFSFSKNLLLMYIYNDEKKREENIRRWCHSNKSVNLYASFIHTYFEWMFKTAQILNGPKCIPFLNSFMEVNYQLNLKQGRGICLIDENPYLFSTFYKEWASGVYGTYVEEWLNCTIQKTQLEEILFFRTIGNSNLRNEYSLLNFKNRERSSDNEITINISDTAYWKRPLVAFINMYLCT